MSKGTADSSTVGFGPAAYSASPSSETEMTGKGSPGKNVACAKMGIQVDFSKVKIGTVQQADIMPEEDCTKILQELTAAWGLGSDRTGEVLATVLMYFVVNGASPRGPAASKLKLNNKELDSHILLALMNNHARRFCRRFADQTLELTQRSDTRQIMLNLASKRGLNSKYYYLVFDFADACTKLTAEERMFVQIVKSKTLEQTSDYDFVAGETAATQSNAMMPKPTMSAAAKSQHLA